EAGGRYILAQLGKSWEVSDVSGCAGCPKGKKAPVDVPIGRWQCVSFDVDVARDGGVRMFVDDDAQPIVDLRADTVGQVAAGYIGFTLGMVDLANTASGEIYFDDLAVAREHLPCTSAR